MAVTHMSRTGKNYYLHSGPKRGGGVQHFFSTKLEGSLAERMPDGFEVYENVGGQVFLRRIQAKLIRDDEQDCILRGIEVKRTKRSYKIEVRGKTLTIHESASEFDERFGTLSRQGRQERDERFMSFQAVVRFVLADPHSRLFAPERYCFRGSVDDWISIGPLDTIQNLASNYLKHLGQDSLYELY